MTSELFRFTSGPRDAKVVLVGEAWGRSEAEAKRPFVGHSGQELDRMLREAGLAREAVLCTNLVHAQPPGNDFTHFLVANKEARDANSYFGTNPGGALTRGIRDLWRLLDRVRPDVVVAAGNWPLHILTDHCKPKTSRGYKFPAGITSWRGSQTYTRTNGVGTSQGSNPWPIPHNRLRVLPLIHPAAILREWGFRSVTVHDLRSRLKRHLAGQLAWEAPTTNDLWKPSFTEVMCLLNAWIARACHNQLRLSVDIETYAKRYISCLGLGEPDLTVCIPFFFFQERAAFPYWTLEEELEIWWRLKTLLEHPNVRIIGQNFIYDSLFLKHYAGINALVAEDTMVEHHLLYPGTPKGLHYLASLYCNHYCYWKDESNEWAASELSAEDLWRYNCQDVRRTFECADVLRNLIARRAGYEAHLAWRMREWTLARKMSLKGFNYDQALRRVFQQDVMEQSLTLQSYLLSVVPTGLARGRTGTPWFASPKMIQELLYAVVGATPVLHKKTKRPTTDDAALEELSSRRDLKWLEPVISRIQALRSMGVIRSHQLDVTLDVRGRFVTQFNVSHPETFRWSSSANPMGEGTNAQNLLKVKLTKEDLEQDLEEDLELGLEEKENEDDGKN